MTKNKKTFVIVAILIILIVILISTIVSSYKKYGGAYIGAGWKSSPEEVFDYAIRSGYYNTSINQKQDSLKIRRLIDVLEFENEIYYIYISEANTFCVFNIAHDTDKDLYHEEYLQVFLYDENLVPTSECDGHLWGYNHNITGDESTIFGFMQTGIAQAYYVNDKKAEVKIYEFEDNGKTYSVDYWYVSGLPKGLDHSDLNLYYEEYNN